MCSLHFIREDFKWTPVRKTLKSDAVPTVFSWTRDFTPRRELFKHITPNKKPKLQSENETLLDSISEEVNQEEDIQESEEQLRNPRLGFHHHSFSNKDNLPEASLDILFLAIHMVATWLGCTLSYQD